MTAERQASVRVDRHWNEHSSCALSGATRSLRAGAREVMSLDLDYPSCSLSGILPIVTDEAKQLLDEALKLPVRQRARLVSSLIESLDENDEADVEQAWIEEVQKRARELETGKIQGLSWAEARRIMLDT